MCGLASTVVKFFQIVPHSNDDFAPPPPPPDYAPPHSGVGGALCYATA